MCSVMRAWFHINSSYYNVTNMSRRLVCVCMCERLFPRTPEKFNLFCKNTHKEMTLCNLFLVIPLLLSLSHVFLSYTFDFSYYCHCCCTLFLSITPIDRSAIRSYDSVTKWLLAFIVTAQFVFGWIEQRTIFAVKPQGARLICGMHTKSK